MTQEIRTLAEPDGLAAALPAVPDALLWEALPELQLNIAQTATLCGISVRQLGYWSKQGYVNSVGIGARRLYSLDAVRGVLAIRQAMRGGASLRQAVRSLETLPPLSPETLRLGGVAGIGDLALAPLPTADLELIAADLMALFRSNRMTRDSAVGLANKIGRSEADVRQAANALAKQGRLVRTAAPDEPIFQNSTEEIIQ